MIIPLRTDSPLRTTPYINWAMIAANAVVFMITLSDHRLASGFALSAREPRLYQFFTYQFLHDGWMHIIGNMLFLYIFGNNINDRLGHVGYLALYLAGGVFAGVSYVVTSSGDSPPMVGASGAVSAVTGAYLVLLPRANVMVLVLYFLGIVEVPSMWFIAGFFALDIYYKMTAPDGVAHMAHVGGTVFGFVVCVLLLFLHLLPRDSFDVVTMFQRWNRRRQYRDLVASGYDPFEYSQPAQVSRYGEPVSPPRPPDARTARVLDLRAAISNLLEEHNLDVAAKSYLQLKQVDPTQVLARQQQLDIANHLAGQQLHPQAAEAYESFLRLYPKSDQVPRVELMLGLIYARYLNEPARARDYLMRATINYHAGRELELAKDELTRLGTGK